MVKINAAKFTYLMLQDDHIDAQRTFYNKHKHLLRYEIVFKHETNLLNAQKVSLVLAMPRFGDKMEPWHKKIYDQWYTSTIKSFGLCPICGFAQILEPCTSVSIKTKHGRLRKNYWNFHDTKKQ